MDVVASRLHFHLLRKCIGRESLKRFVTTGKTYSQWRKIRSLEKSMCYSSNRCLQWTTSICHYHTTSDTDLKLNSNDDSTAGHSKPYRLVQSELSTLCDDIKKKLDSDKRDLRDITHYYFDGQGKAFRPMLIMLMARALNKHTIAQEIIIPAQKEVALVAEMIHTASLIHDDVIDFSSTRRGKSTVDSLWGQKKAILSGDYILAVASIAMARLGNEEAVYIISQYIGDLIRGEFMQLGSKEDKAERFNHYLKKTFKKTASLIANSCKAVAVFADCDEEVKDIAYIYGRNVGIAFQLIDDILDFTSCDQVLGKPTTADLRLGLATAPVLFASSKYPELHQMIMRRFCVEGDVERARELVAMSDGVEQTRQLAEEHCKIAWDQLKLLQPSNSRDALHNLGTMILTRSK